MICSLSSSKGVLYGIIKGTTIGVIQGDTRSLDYDTLPKNEERTWTINYGNCYLKLTLQAICQRRLSVGVWFLLAESCSYHYCSYYYYHYFHSLLLLLLVVPLLLFYIMVMIAIIP